MGEDWRDKEAAEYRKTDSPGMEIRLGELWLKVIREVHFITPHHQVNMSAADMESFLKNAQEVRFTFGNGQVAVFRRDADG